MRIQIVVIGIIQTNSTRSGIPLYEMNIGVLNFVKGRAWCIFSSINIAYLLDSRIF